MWGLLQHARLENEARNFQRLLLAIEQWDNDVKELSIASAVMEKQLALQEKSISDVFVDFPSLILLAMAFHR